MTIVNRLAVLPADFAPVGLPGFVFRLARLDDAHALQAACYPERPFRAFQTYFESAMRWQSNGRSYCLLITHVSGDVVASGQLILYPHGVELANLIVASSWRGQGIGTAMIGWLITAARHNTIPRLEISVSSDNHLALALYQRLGFREDRRVRLPQNETAVVLSQELLSQEPLSGESHE